MLGNVEVVHHHHVGQVNALYLLDLTVLTNAYVFQIRLLKGEIAERQHFPSNRANFGVGGHGTSQRASVILVANGVQILVYAPRPVGLFKAKYFASVGNNMGITLAAFKVA